MNDLTFLHDNICNYYSFLLNTNLKIQTYKYAFAVWQWILMDGSIIRYFKIKCLKKYLNIKKN